MLLLDEFILFHDQVVTLLADFYIYVIFVCCLDDVFDELDFFKESNF
jgi:hypothetical protein